MSNFEHVLFKPYVGPGYRDAARRILIVGETHYGEPQRGTSPVYPTCGCKLDGRNLVGSLPHDCGSHPDRVAALSRESRVSSARHCVYNFVQTMMPDISIRPTWKQAEDSGPAFREVVDFLDPTHVLVTGAVPWHGLETAIGVGTTREFGGRFVQFKTLPTPSGEAVAIKIAHLSRASADEWIGPVGAFLQHEHATALST